jgi:hypothetical protein
VAELEEQVAYLKAFGQACRVQLRSYLEALLSDVESEWGRSDPTALPESAASAQHRPPAPRSSRAGSAAPAARFEANTVAGPPSADAEDRVVQVVAVRE